MIRCTHLAQSVLVAVVTALGCGPSPARRTAAHSPGAELAGYDDARILSVASTLAQNIGLDPMKRAEVDTALRKLLAHPAFVDVRKAEGVQAVGAYRLGEGGFVVKITRGNGEVRVSSEQAPRPFDLEATSFGAIVGGRNAWGVMLFCGLQSAEAISGTYEGAVATATAVDETAGVTRLRHAAAPHLLYMTGTAAGLSADAGRAKLTLALK